jgi:hypothetical protein
VKKLLLLLSFLFLILFSGYFIGRNYVLSSMISKKTEDLKKKNAELIISSAKFSGISEISLLGIVLKEKGKETLFYADTLIVDISLSSLVRLKIRALNLYVGHSALTISNVENKKNYSFLFRGNESSQDSRSTYEERIERISNLLFDFPAQDMEIHSMLLNFQKDSISIRASINNGVKKAERFGFNVFTSEENKSASWSCTGILDNSNRNLDVKVSADKKYGKDLPYIKKRYGITLSFDSLKFQLAMAEKDSMIMAPYFEAYGVNLQHWRLSSETIEIPYGLFHSTINIHDNYFKSDSTLIKVNKLPINFKGSFDYNKKETEVFADFQDVEADTFFTSLPKGLFSDLQGIKAKGKLSYSLYLQLPYKNPDSLKFNSSLSKKDFKILKYGSTDFSLMNKNFTYTAYEKGNPVKSFVVGIENPMFYPLDQISEYLKSSVLTSEDGSFFYHKGFNEDAFRQSIATNIKEKRFVRGGSTVSMQLVKNVFLTRNKTVSRKIEEALIVWLIENNRIVSKERMYEVYLNIIEWAPGIYGIGEASNFYFSKKPLELTLSESIFLAMIVPRPKAFKYNFEEGHLKPYVADYYRLIAGHLVKKQIITEEEKNLLIPDVELSGPAKLMLKSKVEIPVEEEVE